jgi:hypothetical protein
MPLYFFHIWDGETLHQDARGRELPGIQDVIRQADENAKGAMREAAVRSQDVSGHSLEVVDKNGEQIVTLPFARAIEQEPAESSDGL